MTQSTSGGARVRWAILLVLLAAGSGVAFWWFRGTAAVPPLPDLTGVDPEVADLVQTARQDVIGAPRNGARWGHLGMVFRAHAFGNEANFCFEQAERLDPKEPRWPYYRGLTLVLISPREGLDCLRRAIERLDEDISAPRFRLIEALLEQGELEEAAGHLDRVRAASPDHPRGMILLARLAVARLDWKGAQTQAEACLLIPTVARQAHLLAGEAYRRLGQTTRADELLNQGMKLPPDPLWPDPFVAEVEQLQVGTPVVMGQAEKLFRAGQPQEAIELLESLLRRSPRDIAARIELGKVHLRLNQYNEAEQVFQQATVLSPESVDAWFQLGVARVLLADARKNEAKRREAVSAFREVVRLKPDHAVGYHNLAVCLRTLGDRTEARKAWQQALRCQPDYRAAQEGLAELQKAEGKGP